MIQVARIHPYQSVCLPTEAGEIAGLVFELQSGATTLADHSNRLKARTNPMNKIIIMAASLSAVLLTSNFSQAANVPCEDALKELRALESKSTASDAVKTEVAALEAKGVERCNADDDKRADDFFAQATKLLTK